MSSISERIRSYVDDPTTSGNYGEWGALRPDQRRLIRKLCDICDIYEQAADAKQAEIERLKAENAKLKHEMSYMTRPNTIGDTHEMGAW